MITPINFFLKSSLRSEYLIATFITLFLILMPVVGVFALTHVKTEAQASSVYNATSYPGDLYDWGNCTWWAAMRRSQIGEHIPNTWGNASTWAIRALNDGYIVDHSPSYGAIMQIPNVDYGLGHVAFVESVDNDGTWHISEMNVLGLDVVDYKALSPIAATKYNFIHSKN